MTLTFTPQDLTKHIVNYADIFLWILMLTYRNSVLEFTSMRTAMLGMTKTIQ